MTEQKKFYFKLGIGAHVFYDTSSQLKVTKGVPGVTLKPKTKQTLEATRNGHISEISKIEYDAIIASLPPNQRQMVKAEHEGKPLPKPMTQEEEDKIIAAESGEGNLSEKEEEDDSKGDPKRADLIKQLNAIKGIPKLKKQELAESGTVEDIQEFIDNNSK